MGKSILNKVLVLVYGCVTSQLYRQRRYWATHCTFDNAYECSCRLGFPRKSRFHLCEAGWAQRPTWLLIYVTAIRVIKSLEYGNFYACIHAFRICIACDMNEHFLAAARSTYSRNWYAETSTLTYGLCTLTSIVHAVFPDRLKITYYFYSQSGPSTWRRRIQA